MRHSFDAWVGKIPWRRKGNPLRYSCRENPTDRRAWRATSDATEHSPAALSPTLAGLTLSLLCPPTSALPSSSPKVLTLPLKELRYSAEQQNEAILLSFYFSLRSNTSSFHPSLLSPFSPKSCSLYQVHLKCPDKLRIPLDYKVRALMILTETLTAPLYITAIWEESTSPTPLPFQKAILKRKCVMKITISIHDKIYPKDYDMSGRAILVHV